jgi:hypothetical protein
MKRDEAFFGERPLDLIYIAKKLKDALALEQLLTSSGIDYLVETDTYVGGLIIRGSRVGAFFYVGEKDLDKARATMREDGYKPYEPAPE